MTQNKTPGLSNREKRELKNWIFNSVNSYRNRRNKVFLFSIAASIAIIVASVLFFQKNENKNPAIEDFVKSTSNVNLRKTNEVTLILGDNTKLGLDENDSKIQYSANGTNVNLGKGKSYKQQAMVDKKPIFNTILVPYGKRTDVTLSDGTRVWINSGSRIVYPAIFKKDTREVYLEGEAIFKVAHNEDKPFKVLSTNQEIEVLGTVFNVSHYPEDAQMSTVLKSGSIKITYEGDASKSYKITPGTLSSYNRNTAKVERRKVNVDDYFGWREGYLSLKKDRLDQIAAKLSRYYNVGITISDEQLAEETFSGRLDLKEDMDRVIEIIGETTKIQVTKENGNLIITN